MIRYRFHFCEWEQRNLPQECWYSVAERVGSRCTKVRQQQQHKVIDQWSVKSNTSNRAHHNKWAGLSGVSPGCSPNQLKRALTVDTRTEQSASGVTAYSQHEVTRGMLRFDASPVWVHPSSSVCLNIKTRRVLSLWDTHSYHQPLDSPRLEWKDKQYHKWWHKEHEVLWEPGEVPSSTNRLHGVSTVPISSRCKQNRQEQLHLLFYRWPLHELLWD